MFIFVQQSTNMSKKLYWGEREELLCKQWLTATTQIEFTAIYKALQTPLNKMAESIMRKYFAVPASKQDEMLDDCKQEVFIKLNRFNPQISKSYSFCSMVIKHYLHQKMVYEPNRTCDIKYDYRDEMDEESVPIEYYEKEEPDYKAVIKHFEKLRDEYIEMQKRAEKRLANNPKKLKESTKKNHGYIQMFDRCIEYIEKFQNANPNLMAEYAKAITPNKSNENIRNKFYRLFKVTVTIPHDKEKSSMDKRGYDYIDDDFTPNENRNAWKTRTYRRYKENKRINDEF